MDKYFRCFGLPGALPLTTLLSLFALLLAAAFPAPARWLCFAAMLFSSFGDILLARLPAIKKIIPNYFAVGACMFMIAHLLYALCYAQLIRQSGAALVNPGLILMLGIAACIALYVIRLSKVSGRMNRLPLILVYIIAITADCALVFSYAWAQGLSNPLAMLAAVGAASFFISDLIIGLELVSGCSRWGHLIWWYYPIGQFLMILGVGRG